MLVLGLTGNIGCGKSSLSNILIENNIDVVDADIIARHIFEDKDLLQKVFDAFGENIINSDQTLNRKALGNIVFNNDKKLILLNSLTHPKIKEKIIDKINEAKNNNKDIIVIDAALLVEGGYLDIVDKLVVVTCDEEIQIQRIQKRDNCSKEEALSRIKSQMKQEEKIKYGDFIIDNSGSIIELKEKVYNFIKYMKEKWCD
ncbi:dephospho-CoA kinase [[Clostridium] dakarense]|uniref:dephospho-CoA kinase n=1 Tax=Faecalimicrobium dakarense TaxID=1301100 RepID=UPI0005AACA6B|nr:dephospho-CoA kinase [[Clostridium] dakarense]